MEKDQNKKKSKIRGQNYTEQEKQMFLEILKRYRHIIADKRTNSSSIKYKAQTWQKIANEFNSSATSGQRSIHQLKHFYDNLKHKGRKESAAENKLLYKKRLEGLDVTAEDIINVKKIATTDKKEINKTGGGSYIPKLKDSDCSILGIIKDQIKPSLQNIFDDSAVYFGDTNDYSLGSTEFSDREQNDFNTEDLSKNNNEADEEHEGIEKLTEKAKPVQISHEIRAGEEGEREEVRKKIRSVQTTNQIKKMEGNLKTRYFRAKLKNALLERKFMYRNQKKKQIKDKLELQILKRRHELLQKKK